MVLIAQTTAGHSLAFKVGWPLSRQELERLAAIQSFPSMVGAEWTGREGDDIR